MTDITPDMTSLAVADPVQPSTAHLFHEKLQTSGIEDPLREQCISSAQRLPDDILVLIFEESLSLTMHWQSGLWTSPWLLGTVCRRWREATISYPSLWSGITFFPNEFTGIPLQIQQERLETLLARAGDSQPLKICVSTRHLPSTKPMRLLFRTFLSHIHRSKVLTVFDGKLPNGIRSLSVFHPGDHNGQFPAFQHLEALEIRTAGDAWVQWPPLRNTPLLTNLKYRKRCSSPSQRSVGRIPGPSRLRAVVAEPLIFSRRYDWQRTVSSTSLSTIPIRIYYQEYSPGETDHRPRCH